MPNSSCEVGEMMRETFLLQFYSLMNRRRYYLRQRRRYMFLSAFVCLSVCLSARLLARLLKTACWIWMKCCMSIVERCRDMDEQINF